MFDLIVILTVREPAAVAGVIAALERMRPVVLEEPGCIHWDAFHSADDPQRIVLVELWATREDWVAHDGLSGIQDIYLPEVLPHVDREIHPSTRLGAGG